MFHFWMPTRFLTSRLLTYRLGLLAAATAWSLIVTGCWPGFLPPPDGGERNNALPDAGVQNAEQNGIDDAGADGGAAADAGRLVDGGPAAMNPTLGNLGNGSVCGFQRTQIDLWLPAGSRYTITLTSPGGDDPDLHLYRSSDLTHVQRFGRAVGTDEIVVRGDANPAWVAEVSSYNGVCHSWALTVTAQDGPEALSWLSGRVNFENRVYGNTGFTGELVPVPARGVQVALVNNDDDVLATTTTDGEGGYGFAVLLEDTGSYRLRALAALEAFGQWSRVRDQSDAQAIYAMESALFGLDTAPSIDGRPSFEPLALAVEEGGAFNIIDTVYLAYRTLDAYTEKRAPALTLAWQRGESIGCGSCYSNDRILLGGQFDDPDEYDDDIILHEFAHFWAEYYAPDTSPGGSHRDMRVIPALAWGEGLAYYFSSAVRNDPTVVDNYIDDLRFNDQEAVTLNGEVLADFFGTADGTLAGSLREEIVSGILWDLHDDNDNEEHDTVSLGASSLLRALSDHFFDLPVDIGPPGIELADGLHAVVCSDPGLRAGAERLTDERALPWPADLETAPCQESQEKTRRRGPQVAVERRGQEVKLTLLPAVEALSARVSFGEILRDGSLQVSGAQNCTSSCQILLVESQAKSQAVTFKSLVSIGSWVRVANEAGVTWKTWLTPPGRASILSAGSLRAHKASKLKASKLKASKIGATKTTWLRAFAR